MLINLKKNVDVSQIDFSKYNKELTSLSFKAKAKFVDNVEIVVNRIFYAFKSLFFHSKEEILSGWITNALIFEMSAAEVEIMQKNSTIFSKEKDSLISCIKDLDFPNDKKNNLISNMTQIDGIGQKILNKSTQNQKLEKDGGIGVEKDSKEAARLYKLAADQGDAAA